MAPNIKKPEIHDLDMDHLMKDLPLDVHNNHHHEAPVVDAAAAPVGNNDNAATKNPRSHLRNEEDSIMIDDPIE